MRFLLSGVILLGLSFPYIIQFIIYDYQMFVILVLKNIISGNLSSISSFMAFAAIIAYAFRIKQGPGSLQDSLIVTTLTMPVVFPSLVMIGIIISQGGQISSEYFRAASDLYLVGITSLVIALPFIGIINQWYNGLKSRGSPFSQIVATMIIFSLINFVFISASFSEEITLASEQLKIHGVNIILDGIFALQLVLNNILQTGNPVIPQNITANVRPYFSPIIGGTVFGISSAFYLYFRLYRKYSEDEKSINSLTKKSPLLKLDNLGHISRIIMVGIIINFIIIIGASFFIEAMDLILKSTVLFLMFLFMIGIVSEKTIKRSGL